MKVVKAMAFSLQLQVLFRLFVFLAALHFRCGQQSELLISINRNAEIIMLECSDRGFTQRAQFTFRNPISGELEKQVSTKDSQPAFSVRILPENESVVNCRVEGAPEESESVIITGTTVLLNS